MPLFFPVLHRRRLSSPVWVTVLDANQIVIFHCRGIREGKRCRLHRPVERAPNIDDPYPALEELFGFVGEMMMHPRRGGFGSLIDVDPGHRVSVACGASDGVVEQEDTLSARDVLEEDRLDLRVVVLFD